MHFKTALLSFVETGVKMKNILIWGTGNNTTHLLKNGVSGNLVGFIESKKTKEIFHGLPVYSASEISDIYDCIIVASIYVEEIYNVCKRNCIELNKMIFLFPIHKYFGMQDIKYISEILGEKNYLEYCLLRGEYRNTFFDKDLNDYNRMNERSNFIPDKKYFWPIISEKYANNGEINNYFWQDVWAARLIHESGVEKHFDIGSRVDGFIAHLLAMKIDVTLIDVRPLSVQIENLKSIIDDATTLRQLEDESIDSMSALCSLEHFGLGRYGDPVDPEACFKCFENIQRKLRKNAHLYVSVPVGYERVEFNAHRIFYARTIRECFGKLNLIEYSCAADGKIEKNVALDKYDNDIYDGEYRYGLFHFMK